MGFRCTCLTYFKGAVIPSLDFENRVMYTYMSKDTTKGEGGMFWQINGEHKNNKPVGNNKCNGLLIMSESRCLQLETYYRLGYKKPKQYIIYIGHLGFAICERNSSLSVFYLHFIVSLEVTITLILLVSRLRHKSKVADKISDSAKHLSTCSAVNTCTIP